jgi:hypothetical protein
VYGSICWANAPEARRSTTTTNTLFNVLKYLLKLICNVLLPTSSKQPYSAQNGFPPTEVPHPLP